MGFKPKQPDRKLVKPLKYFDQVVVVSEKTDVDTKSLAAANKELKAAAKQLVSAKKTSHKIYAGIYKQAGDVIEKPPAGPIPIPYPNFSSDGKASKTALKKLEKAKKSFDKAHAKAVKVIDKEIKVLGASNQGKDEAATMKGLVSAKSTGKAYFAAWSMDVKIEGKNVERVLDLAASSKK